MKVQSVIKLADRNTNVFGEGEHGYVRKVEIYTFEKRV